MSTTHVSEQDLLIAEYTLGLLNLQETAQAQTLLGKDSQAVVAALQWEDRFLGLVDQLTPIEPPINLLQRIQTALGQDITPLRRPAAAPRAPMKAEVPASRPAAAAAAAGTATSGPASAAAPTAGHPMPKAPAPNAAAPRAAAARAATPRVAAPKTLLLGSLWFWRVLSVILACVAVTFALKPNQTVVNIPPPTEIETAILQAPGQTSTPGWILTTDAKHNLMLNPQVHIDVPADAVVQLWTHNEQAPQPRSLGVLKPNQAATIPAATLGAIVPGQIFEMTLEPAGAPVENPSGPILFIGRMVVITQEPGQPVKSAL